MSTEIQVPPAVAHALAEKITDGDVDAALAALREMLTATTSIRVPSNSLSGYAYKEVPDPRAVIPAARAIIEFRHGKATQTVKHSGTVGHLHATPAELIAQAAQRIGNTERVVREYLPASDAAQPISTQEPAAKEVVPIDV